MNKSWTLYCIIQEKARSGFVSPWTAELHLRGKQGKDIHLLFTDISLLGSPLVFQTSILLGGRWKYVGSSLVSRHFWRQHKKTDGVAKIKSWNLWEQSVCVPRIKAESCLCWLRPKACNNTWVYCLVQATNVAQNINIWQLYGAKTK